MATHSSVLAWRIPGMGDSGGLPSMGLHRVRHNWSDLPYLIQKLRITHMSIRGEQWINKMSYIHTVKYDSVIKARWAETCYRIQEHLKISCLVKVGYTRLHSVWSHVHEIPRTGKSIETESTIVFARGQGYGEEWELINNEHKVSFWSSGNIWEWVLVVIQLYEYAENPWII